MNRNKKFNIGMLCLLAALALIYFTPYAIACDGTPPTSKINPDMNPNLRPPDGNSSPGNGTGPTDPITLRNGEYTLSANDLLTKGRVLNIEMKRNYRSKPVMGAGFSLDGESLSVAQDSYIVEYEWTNCGGGGVVLPPYNDSIYGYGNNSMSMASYENEPVAPVGPPKVSPQPPYPQPFCVQLRVKNAEGVWSEPDTFEHAAIARTEYDSRFGYGWDMSYNLKVRELPNTNPQEIVYFNGKGGRIIYTFDSADNKYKTSSSSHDYFLKQSGIYTLYNKDGSTIIFNSIGDVFCIKDRNPANYISFTYDLNEQGNNKKLTQITDDLNRNITLTYFDPNGFLHTVTDFAGRTWTYGYDERGDLRSVTGPATSEYTAGLTISYSYDANHQLVSIIDANGQSWIENHYDNGKVVQQRVGSAGSNYTLSYDPGASTATLTERNTASSNYTFNDRGNILSQTKYVRNALRDGTDNKSNLEAWWKCDDNGGGTIHDSANSHNGTCFYSDRWVDGLFGGALTYSWDDCDWVMVSDDAALRFTQTDSFSISFWAKPGNIPDYLEGLEQDVISKIAEYQQSGKFGFKTQWCGDKFAFTVESSYSSSTTVDSGTDSASPGNWYHVVAVYDNTQMKIYIDGVSKGTGTWQGNASNGAPHTHLGIGASLYDDGSTVSAEGDFFTGIIDEVQIYRKALTAQEVSDLYNSYGTYCTTQYEYNNNQEMTKVTLPKGNYVSYGYDSMGNVTTFTKAAQGGTPSIATQFTYESTFNKVKTITDPCSNVYTCTYDYEGYPGTYSTNVGNLMKVVFPTVKNETGGDVTPELNFTYNNYGQVETIKLQDNKFVKYEYGTSGNDNGRVTSITYDYGTGDALNIVYRISYDSYGNIDRVAKPDSKEIDLDYNALLQLTEIHNELGYTTKLHYNKNKMLDKVQRQLGQTYDDTSAQTWQYQYDILDKLKNVTNPMGYITEIGRDKNQNITSVKDPEGRDASPQYSTNYLYDDRDLVVRMTDAESGQVNCGYDENGKRIWVKDDNGKQTNYYYDFADRLWKIVYPDSTYRQFTYDRNSNIKEERKRDGTIIYYTYDKLNRRVTKQIGSGTITHFKYDIMGRLRFVVDDTTTVASYSYDRIGRLTSAADSTNGTVDYQSNENSLREKLTYPDSSYITYEYYDDGRVHYIKDDSGTPQTLATFDYDELGRLKKVTYGNGQYEEFDFEDAGTGNDNKGLHIKAVSYSATSLYGYNYQRDKIGNVTQKTCGSSTFSFSYDKTYQLKTADYPGSNDDWTFNYDKVYNRTSTVQNSTTRSYTLKTNGLNQYDTISNPQKPFSYDTNGNLTDDGTSKYAFNVENYMTTLKDQSDNIVATYTYDWAGRRISKEIYGGVTTTFVYDGAHIIAEYENGSLKRKYVYGPGIDFPIMMTTVDGETQTRYYYFHDALGSVVALLNNSGSVFETYSYDPFGKPTIRDDSGQVISASSISNSWMFTGRQWDSESGLYYYRARMYNPQLGRFLQPDPIGYYDSMNLYQYCGNNPVNWIDPSGKSFASMLPGMLLPFLFPGDGGDNGSGKNCPNGKNPLNDLLKDLWDALNKMMPDAAGLSLNFSWLNPFTSGLGGVAGLNSMAFRDPSAPMDYQFEGGPLDPSFDLGISAQAVLAWGSGDWSGSFDAYSISVGPYSASYFWSTDSNSWSGIAVGPNVGAPVGVAHERTNYTPSH